MCVCMYVPAEKFLKKILIAENYSLKMLSHGFCDYGSHGVCLLKVEM